MEDGLAYCECPLLLLVWFVLRYIVIPFVPLDLAACP
jgi:hypothetical protein